MATGAHRPQRRGLDMALKMCIDLKEEDQIWHMEVEKPTRKPDSSQGQVKNYFRNSASSASSFALFASVFACSRCFLFSAAAFCAAAFFSAAFLSAAAFFAATSCFCRSSRRADELAAVSLCSRAAG